MEDSPQLQAAPTISEVLHAVAGELDDVEGTIERVTIQRATDRHYVGKCFRVGSDEFDGFSVEFSG